MLETKLIMITCTCFVKVCMGSVMQAFIHHSHDRGGHCTIRTIYNLLSLERWQPWHIHVPLMIMVATISYFQSPSGSMQTAPLFLRGCM